MFPVGKLCIKNHGGNHGCSEKDTHERKRPKWNKEIDREREREKKTLIDYLNEVNDQIGAIFRK